MEIFGARQIDQENYYSTIGFDKDFIIDWREEFQKKLKTGIMTATLSRKRKPAISFQTSQDIDPNKIELTATSDCDLFTIPESKFLGVQTIVDSAFLKFIDSSRMLLEYKNYNPESWATMSEERYLYRRKTVIPGMWGKRKFTLEKEQFYCLFPLGNNQYQRRDLNVNYFILPIIKPLF